jgi:Na+/H+ antiporter NhaC
MALTGDRVVDLASALLMTQTVILGGMIKAGIVDAQNMIDWLQSLIDSLRPEERTEPYGMCLTQVVTMIRKNSFPTQGPFIFH